MGARPFLPENMKAEAAARIEQDMVAYIGEAKKQLAELEVK